MVERTPFLSVQETAALFRVHPQVVYRAVNAGEIPSVRVGRIIRIPRADVEAMARQSVASSPKTNGRKKVTPEGTTSRSRASGKSRAAETSTTSRRSTSTSKRAGASSAKRKGAATTSKAR